MKPGDWVSERMVFGCAIIFGYLLIVIAGMILLHKDSLSIIHDAMLGLGPIVGIIAQAIWKTDKTDKQVAETAAVAANTAATLAAKAPDQSGVNLVNPTTGEQK